MVSFEVYHWDRFGRDILLGKVDINTGAKQAMVCRHGGADAAVTLVRTCSWRVSAMLPVNVPSNKLVRFQASLEDTSGVEFDGELHVEVRKDVTHAIPEHAFDPDSKVPLSRASRAPASTACSCQALTVLAPVQLQTIANRMTLARLELHNLKTAIEKRKKHAAEKVKPAPGAHTCVPHRPSSHTRTRVLCETEKAGSADAHEKLAERAQHCVAVQLSQWREWQLGGDKE